MPHSLLLVDDEPSVLRGLKRVFHRQGYKIRTTTRPLDALRIIEEDQVGVLISDYRMPLMNGVELLETIQQRCPDTVRILLTGQADLDAVIAAINRGDVYKFLVKPCDADKLRNCVRGAFRQYNLVRENRRLVSELSQANAELQNLNRDLEIRVEDKARELTQALNIDTVTALPNRAVMTDRLGQAVIQSHRNGVFAALILFGIDRFQRVNESLGHKVGDELLHTLAGRVLRHVREADTLARTGGDEFGIVISDAGSAQDAERVAKRILDELSTPFTINHNDIFITVSMGISVSPTDGDSADALFLNATAAMHQAKQEGRQCYRFYAEHLNIHSRRHLALETELRHALEREDFVVHYQPRVDAASGKMVGVEALLRLNHPQRGLVAPAEFIPVLEDTGLIVPVGAWVLEEARRAVARWCAQQLPPIRVSVNLSPRQFQSDGLLETVQKMMRDQEEDLPSGWLEIELTEGILMKDEPLIQHTLAAFHGMGITLAIDDFGTGYSSLSYLSRFPIDVLKVDQSFVRGIGQDHDSQAVVKAIISMGHALHMQVVAEGIETEAQRDILQSLGCDEFQGFLFSRPVAEEQLVQLLGAAGFSVSEASTVPRLAIARVEPALPASGRYLVSK